MILLYINHTANEHTFVARVRMVLAQHDVSVPRPYDVATALWGAAAYQRFHVTRDIISVEAELHSPAWR